MDVQAYLNRIGYQGKLEPDLALLRELQSHHIYKIPFENLDIHYGRKIRLDKDQIFQKLMVEHRGGFCYELNGLFYFLLEELGYRLVRISARVYGSNGELGPEYDHLAILCQLAEGLFLVDVGFGEFSLYPLAFQTAEEIEDPRGRYRFEVYDETHFLLSKKVDEIWKAEYLFSPEDRTYQEFEKMCEFHQISEHSPFTQKRVCSLAIPDGRISLLNDRLKIRKGEQTKEIDIHDEKEVKVYLDEYFGIRSDFWSEEFSNNSRPN
ncbi:MAG: arylamine N-acetyltransferase [Bacteroidia bacterium]|nr:arylamine N-acetyltransferase [Bacteroidia bacterium]